jgi:hypothetical protein
LNCSHYLEERAYAVLVCDSSADHNSGLACVFGPELAERRLQEPSVFFGEREEIHLVWRLDELPLLNIEDATNDLEDATNDLLGDSPEAICGNQDGHWLLADIGPTLAQAGEDAMVGNLVSSESLREDFLMLVMPMPSVARAAAGFSERSAF